MTTSTLDEIATAAAWTLPGTPRRTVEPRDPDHFVAAVAEQRISGLVVAAATAGALHTSTPRLTEQLHATHLEALRTSLAVEAASVEVSTLLDRAGIRHALLKGCATARLDYPDPSLRITGDVDVLVDRSSYAAALDCLDRAGIGRLVPPFRTYWEQRYGKDIALRGAAGIEVDLHLGLVGGYFGVGAATGPLLDELVDFPLAGRRLPALDPVGRIVHAAVHSAGGPAIRLGSAADVIVLAADPAVTAGSVAERSRRLRCEPLVAAGIVRAGRTFGVDLGADHDADLGADHDPLGALGRWAAGVEPTAAETHALGALTRPGGEGVWLTGARRLPWSRRAGYVAPLLLPSRRHLRARGRTLPGHLRQSVRRLAGN
jgi:hypothetical protein